MYVFCWSYCFCIVRFGLTLGVSALQILPYITLWQNILHQASRSNNHHHFQTPFLFSLLNIPLPLTKVSSKALTSPLSLAGTKLHTSSKTCSMVFSLLGSSRIDLSSPITVSQTRHSSPPFTGISSFTETHPRSSFADTCHPDGPSLSLYGNRMN